MGTKVSENKSRPKPKASLATFDVFCMVAGAMISSGLFVLPGVMLARHSAATVAAYLLAGFLVIPAMVSQAELATAMPRSGGSYFFIERSMGLLAGALAGTAGWLSIMLKAAFALVGLGAVVLLIKPDAPYWVIQTIAISATVLLTALNAISTHHAGRLQNVLVVLLLATLTYFVLAGARQCEAVNYTGVFSLGYMPTLAAAAMVFISFGGLTSVASVAEEVRNPGRAIPIGMFAAALVVWILYVLCAAILVGIDAGKTAGGSYAPLAETAILFGGRTAEVIMSLAALMAFVTTANSGILAASRQPLAMARDGMLPKWLAGISEKTNTPLKSVLLTGAIIAALIATTDLETLVKAASTVMLGLFALVNISVIVMRSSGLHNYRPLFKSPLYPWMQIVGTIAYSAMIALMGYKALALCAGMIVAVLLWWLLALRKRSSGRQSALVYLVNRLASPVFKRGDLEDELRSIALDRDEIVHDRFDKLISECSVLDMTGSVTRQQLFDSIAEEMAPQLDCDARRLREMFIDREKNSSTTIMPSLAIPHVICPGENKFAITLVRCADGAVMSTESEPVRIVFAMASSEDQRNYHLKALMAVAHIASEHDFVRRWLSAPDAEHLRDLVLLSNRERHH